MFSNVLLIMINKLNFELTLTMYIKLKEIVDKS